MPRAPSGDQWERLLTHLDLAEGFNLLFLINPSIQHAELTREACASWLRQEGRSLEIIPPLDARHVSDIANLLLIENQSVSEVLWVSLYPDPFLVSGAHVGEEYAAWNAAMGQGLAGLNQARNLLVRRQRRPVIFAGTDELLQRCPRVAPDLWSIRRGVIILPADTDTQSFTPNIRAEPILDSDDRDPIQPPAASLADAERALTAADKVRGRPGAEYDLLRYLIRAAIALEGRGHLKELNRVIDEAVEILRRPDLPEAPTELSSLILDVARRLENSARYAEAEPLYRLVLDRDQKVFGPEHPDVARDFMYLARLLHNTNRLTEAEILFRQALAIDEKTYGAEHPRVATDLNNLVLVLNDTNRYSEAEPLMRRALAIDEKNYGPAHPRVGVDLDNLALLLADTDRLTEAEPLMRRALSIAEKYYGPDHSTIGIPLNNLANLLQQTKRFAEAEPLLRRVVRLFEKSYGPEHPNVALALNNLAQVLKQTGRFADAEPLMRRAMTIDRNNYGSAHPSVARDLNNLARLLQATNRRNDAEKMMREMLDIYVHFRSRTGYDHPNFQYAVENYRLLLKEMGWDDNRIANHVSKITETAKGQVSAPENPVTDL
jgi:tetratricopeptide (TPR) repeat protein